jgi:hypothetical protein
MQKAVMALEAATGRQVVTVEVMQEDMEDLQVDTAEVMQAVMEHRPAVTAEDIPVDTEHRPADTDIKLLILLKRRVCQ